MACDPSLAALFAWLGEPTGKVPGTQRGRTPMETLALLRPLWGLFGVTRLANVTGLDWIGIPVVMAVRPNSRTLAVSQGKGIDLDAAKASALMESLELWHAEHHRLPRRMASFAELAGEAAHQGGVEVLDPGELPRSQESLWHRERLIPWVRGIDLVSGLRTWVPYELVHADARLPQPKGSGSFTRNTNGLASGNNRAEAVLHALCELIERDAAALFELRPSVKIDRRVDLSSVTEAVPAQLLRQFDDANVDAMVWEMTSDLPIPTFQALILDRGAANALRPQPAAYGAGTHPSRGIALARALTEAAQSRLTHIAGSRDDLSRARYRSIQDAGVLTDFALVAAEKGNRRLDEAPTIEHDVVDDDVAHVVSALARAGIGPIVAVDLSIPELPITVVRLVVAHLEGAIDGPSYRAGARARAVIASEREAIGR